MPNRIYSFIKKITNYTQNRKVLFYRNFLGFQGGHLKTWNYFQYLRELDGFSPHIFFTEKSVWENNPWKGECNIEVKWDPSSADILFLAGLDWSAIKESEQKKNQPVINLIQSVRHADPNDVRYAFLSKKAIRICVSSEVATALQDTNRVNGPIFTIPNGVDVASFSTDLANLKPLGNCDVLISGMKNKQLAQKLEQSLKKRGYQVYCLMENIARENYLRMLASAKVSLLLPCHKEGFYLPALESMALGALTICPDCVGNRQFCVDGNTCFVPEYDFDSLYKSTIVALSLNSDKYHLIRKEAKIMASHYSLKKEQDRFYQIMQKIDWIWKSI